MPSPAAVPRALVPLPPTRRQLEILQLTSDLTERRGFPPSVAELKRSLGLASTNGISEQLDRLENKRLLTSAIYRSRSRRVTSMGRAALHFRTTREDGGPQFVDEQRCLRCGAAYFGESCPACATLRSWRVAHGG